MLINGYTASTFYNYF